MPYLTPTQFREHFETDLGDTALGRLIADAESEIDRRFGPAAAVTEMQHGGGRYLFLARPASSVTQVVEADVTPFGETEVTLSASDYRIWYGGRALERLVTGTNPRDIWGTRVTVTYTPEDDTARRTRVVIDLVKLAVQYTALSSESSGDYSRNTSGTYYQQERERILRALEGVRFA